MFEYDKNAKKAAEKLDEYDFTDFLRNCYNNDIVDPWFIRDKIECEYEELNEIVYDLSLDEFMEYMSARYDVVFDEVITFNMRYLKWVK